MAEETPFPKILFSLHAANNALSVYLSFFVCRSIRARLCKHGEKVPVLLGLMLKAENVATKVLDLLIRTCIGEER
jgi:hypothetical protein